MMRSARARTTAGIIAALVIFAALVVHRRWIADDGLIVVRTVRQLLAGNGPVLNTFERAEANTSTLWTYVLALVCLTGANVTLAAVAVGGALSVAGVALALDATRRWHRARGSDATLVPAGILVVLAVFPFWDFATSGLETGLVTCWIGGAWWLLVTGRWPYLTAVVLGAGPLARPELGLVSVVFLGAGWALLRPTRKQTILLALTAIALPLAYEVFRAGYYGTLVPLPALAKGAAGARWVRGVKYVWDFAKPYWLIVPAVLFGAIAVRTLRGRVLLARDRWLLAAPVVAGLGLLLFVIRVGGDFMHARMCLPATFLVLLPAAVLPARRSIALLLGAVVIWAVYIGIRRGNGRSYASAIAVEDEHYGYVRWTKDAHPVSDATYITAEGPAGQAVLDAVAANERVLLSEGGKKMALANHDARVAFAVGRLGVGGVITPLDGIVVDTFGLANPLGSRITPTNPKYPGHEKSLPWAWILADFADPAVDPAIVGTTPEAVRAARHAMTCGPLAELLASVREPMSASRFWANLTGSIARTRLEFPSDPIEAEKLLCAAAQ